jgi:N-acetylglucosaminyl-diphospho-decaprenol L-rhamnosyltransferase
MNDLAIILVSHHGANWLAPCLDSIREHLGECTAEIVVVNNADDGTEAILARYPSVRLVKCENHGFAHANNRGLLTCDARFVLFLNVDTEVRAGTFEQLVAALDERPSVGMAGVRQVGDDGTVAPTSRWFPNAFRAFGDSVGLERLPARPSWAGERELRLLLYDVEHSCDWTSGSFLVVRREVLQGVGLMDERFFLYSEEPDLCLRAKQAGWEMRHLPLMTILHHAGKAGVNPRLAAQDAFARMQYARKHFSALHRIAYAAALGVGYCLRLAAPIEAERRSSARAALKTLIGASGPPYGPPPVQSFASSVGSA